MNKLARQTLIVLGSGVLTAVLLIALPVALAEPPSDSAPPKIAPNAQQSIVAKNRKEWDPNTTRDGVRPGDIIEPGAQSKQCNLSPNELLLVGNIRSTLKTLAEREARVASREAALRALQANVRNDLDRLKTMRRAVEARVATIERYQLRIDRMRDSEQRLDTLAADTAKSLEDLAKAEKEKADADAKQEGKEQMPEWQATRVQQLAGILKKMKPAQAAPILARQTDAVAVGALEALGSRAAGKILAQMPAERASTLAQKLVNRPLSDKSEATR